MKLGSIRGETPDGRLVGRLDHVFKEQLEVAEAALTTLATIAGHFPLTLVRGPGAIARNSIGVTLVGGMADAQAE